MGFRKKNIKELNKEEILNQKLLENKVNDKKIIEKKINKKITDNKSVNKKIINDKKSSNNRCYLDIETTGGSRKNDYVTIVGLLCNNEFTQFVYNINLKTNSIEDYIKENNINEIIGYNSNKFDLDFLFKKNFIKIETMNLIKSNDLMSKAHKLNIKGGLKGAEKFFNINRETDILDYWGQKNIWNKWINTGNRNILEPLLIYNKDDIINLPLVEECLNKYEKEQGVLNDKDKRKK